jgi:hypothetical protein
MPKLRIIADDAALRATVTASSTQPGLSVASLLTDEPMDVHRMIGKSGSYLLSFAQPELVGGVHFPWTNWSPTATARVRGYSDAGRTQQLSDTGIHPCCPASAPQIRGWTAAQVASAYRYGGGAHARAWFANTAAQYLQIDVSDPNNLQGYLECGRIVVGAWWSPEENADYGATLGQGTASTPSRNGAGTRRQTIGPKFDKQSFTLSHLSASDRATLKGIVRANADAPFIFSLYPDDADAALERDHQGYFYAAPSPMAAAGYERYEMSLELEAV